MSDAAIRLVAGLGNPGAGYAATRHNAGFWLADRVAEAFGGSFKPQPRFSGELAEVSVGGRRLLLLKPDTFMNRSGRAVQALAAYYRIAPAEILVAHDELDLPAGVARLKHGGGHGGHNGLRDIHRCLGPDYRRLRLGIGHPGTREQVHDYVLGKPSRADEQLIRNAVDDGLRAIETMLRDGWDAAMKQLHTRA